MTARELEAALLIRCTDVARAVAPTAQDQREANVFQLAATVIRSQFPRESTSLKRASEQYFAAHPDERLASGDVVRNGWVASLSRLRDMLSQQLNGH
ncbi:hypothetical protein [Variovorax sp. PBL-E5]|uniref:hypothetical protein n=1 Tax=Variovorax sp. PBL-E5 TaxID=434014 RepID=UPI001316CFA6|nr:hypothetical protein [Variovorax sp. PBL-E5]VTU26382.1 hypothetical protein E5CHR_02185 [Variovorax sp. PBL-E5]